MQFRKALPHDMAEIKRIARDVIRHNYIAFLEANATAPFDFFILFLVKPKE